MIITTKFCWGHLGKTGGNSTKKMFDILELKDIIVSHEISDPNKHLIFSQYKDLCKDQKKILNIRRLATWIISDWNHFYITKKIQTIKKESIIEGSVFRGTDIIADDILKTYYCEELGGIDYWLRTEYLAEDFLKVIKNFEDISQAQQAKIRKIKANQAKNLKQTQASEFLGVKYTDAEELVKLLFTKEEIENMYKRNPFWAQIEKEMYGNLLYEELDESETAIIRKPTDENKRKMEQVKKAKDEKTEVNNQGVIAKYRKKIASGNAPVSVYVKLGNALAEKGKMGQAIKVYEQALEKKPDNPNLYVKIAKIYHQQGKLEQAKEKYGAALKINPELASALAGLEKINNNKNQVEGVRKKGKAKRKKKQGINEQDKIIQIIKELLNEDKSKAVAIYEEEKAKNPTFSQKIIKLGPGPLFSNKPKMALFWTPKSGCTFATKWFFYQIGILEKALKYNRFGFVHKYRGKVFYKKVEDAEIIQDILDGKEVPIIKVVRNPYIRAVSSYTHAVKTGYDDEGISKFLGKQITEKDSFSFREFLNYLESINLRTANNHHGLQVHISEELGLVKPNYVVKLENSFEELRQVEIELGLRASDLKKLAESPHHTKKEETDEFCGDKRFLKGKNTAFPNTINFYDDELKERVAKLYRVDFEAYGYDIDKLP